MFIKAKLTYVNQIFVVANINFFRLSHFTFGLPYVLFCRVVIHIFFGCPILLLGFHTFFFAVSLYILFFGCPILLLGFHTFFAVSYDTYVFLFGVPYRLRSHFVPFLTYHRLTPPPIPTALVVFFFSCSPLTSFRFDNPHPHSSRPFLPLTFVQPLLWFSTIAKIWSK